MLINKNVSHPLIIWEIKILSILLSHLAKHLHKRILLGSKNSFAKSYKSKCDISNTAVAKEMSETIYISAHMSTRQRPLIPTAYDQV